MKKTPESESAINELIDNVSKTDEVGERVSEYIGQVWDKKRFLPVLITDTTGDLNQAFLYGLNDALKRDGLLDLAPETYYSIALDRIDDWEQNYFETYKMFERELTQNGRLNIVQAIYRIQILRSFIEGQIKRLQYTDRCFALLELLMEI